MDPPLQHERRQWSAAEYRLNVSVGGDFTLGSGARIDLVGRGYNVGRCPAGSQVGVHAATARGTYAAVYGNVCARGRRFRRRERQQEHDPPAASRETGRRPARPSSTARSPNACSQRLSGGESRKGLRRGRLGVRHRRFHFRLRHGRRLRAPGRVGRHILHRLSRFGRAHGARGDVRQRDDPDGEPPRRRVSRRLHRRRRNDLPQERRRRERLAACEHRGGRMELQRPLPPEGRLHVREAGRDLDVRPRLRPRFRHPLRSRERDAVAARRLRERFVAHVELDAALRPPLPRRDDLAPRPRGARPVGPVDVHGRRALHVQRRRPAFFPSLDRLAPALRGLRRCVSVLHRDGDGRPDGRLRRVALREQPRNPGRGRQDAGIPRRQRRRHDTPPECLRFDSRSSPRRLRRAFRRHGQLLPSRRRDRPHGRRMPDAERQRQRRLDGH